MLFLRQLPPQLIDLAILIIALLLLFIPVMSITSPIIKSVATVVSAFLEATVWLNIFPLLPPVPTLAWTLSMIHYIFFISGTMGIVHTLVPQGSVAYMAMSFLAGDLVFIAVVTYLSRDDHQRLGLLGHGRKKIADTIILLVQDVIYPVHHRATSPNDIAELGMSPPPYKSSSSTDLSQVPSPLSGSLKEATGLLTSTTSE
ncbi:hypothetical protein F5I97DRAFT_1963925 [Phlebopus sp. FC_14]|nr:hypothetical protein F5I97DRAFT_1963925 [Phlebopus sp. FC_14]